MGRHNPLDEKRFFGPFWRTRSLGIEVQVVTGTGVVPRGRDENMILLFYFLPPSVSRSVLRCLWGNPWNPISRCRAPLLLWGCGGSAQGQRQINSFRSLAQCFFSSRDNAVHTVVIWWWSFARSEDAREDSRGCRSNDKRWWWHFVWIRRTTVAFFPALKWPDYLITLGWHQCVGWSICVCPETSTDVHF